MGGKNRNFTNTRRGGGGHHFDNFFSKFLFFLNDGFPYIVILKLIYFSTNRTVLHNRQSVGKIEEVER